MYRSGQAVIRYYLPGLRARATGKNTACCAGAMLGSWLFAAPVKVERMRGLHVVADMTCCTGFAQNGELASRHGVDGVLGGAWAHSAGVAWEGVGRFGELHAWRSRPRCSAEDHTRARVPIAAMYCGRCFQISGV